MQDFCKLLLFVWLFFFVLMDRVHFGLGDETTDFDGHDEDCNYFSVSQYSNIVKTLKFFNQLAFVDFNMRFLPKNKHKIDSFLGQLSNDCLPAIIPMTETKFNNANAKSITIENYQFEHVGDHVFLARPF